MAQMSQRMLTFLTSQRDLMTQHAAIHEQERTDAEAARLQAVRDRDELNAIIAESTVVP